MHKIYSTNVKSENNKNTSPKASVLSNILQFSRSYEVVRSKNKKIGLTLN